MIHLLSTYPLSIFHRTKINAMDKTANKKGFAS